MNKIITTLLTLLLIQFMVVNKTLSDESEVKDCFEKLNRSRAFSTSRPLTISATKHAF